MATTERRGHATTEERMSSTKFLEDGWRAECADLNCGWKSPTFLRLDLAINAGYDHEVATRPAGPISDPTNEGGS